MTEILSVHMGLYWTVLYIGLDEIVLDILYIQFPPKMQISHFFCGILIILSVFLDLLYTPS